MLIDNLGNLVTMFYKTREMDKGYCSRVSKESRCEAESHSYSGM
jgi:hypothetical protein